MSPENSKWRWNSSRGCFRRAASAYQPPVRILEIATQAFTGLAVLFLTTVATLYWRRTRP